MNPSEIKTNRIYSDLAHLLPLISLPAEYAEEAAHWRSVLQEHLGRERKKILELGVGGGFNLSHLIKYFDATAVDISETMLTMCREINQGVVLHQGDMRTVRLNTKYSAVLIHDAISYILSETDLLATFITAAAHLDQGGVLVMSPDHFRETFTSPVVEEATHERMHTKLTYVEYTFDPDPADTTIESIMIYFINSAAGLQIETDHHVTGLFSRATWLELMRTAGFNAEIRTFTLSSNPQPYELLVGVLR